MAVLQGLCRPSRHGIIDNAGAGFNDALAHAGPDAARPYDARKCECRILSHNGVGIRSGLGASPQPKQTRCQASIDKTAAPAILTAVFGGTNAADQ
jgi:hypothetical protein